MMPARGSAQNPRVRRRKRTAADPLGPGPCILYTTDGVRGGVRRGGGELLLILPTELSLRIQGERSPLPPCGAEVLHRLGSCTVPCLGAWLPLGGRALSECMSLWVDMRPTCAQGCRFRGGRSSPRGGARPLPGSDDLSRGRKSSPPRARQAAAKGRWPRLRLLLRGRLQLR